MQPRVNCPGRRQSRCARPAFFGAKRALRLSDRGPGGVPVEFLSVPELRWKVVRTTIYGFVHSYSLLKLKGDHAECQKQLSSARKFPKLNAPTAPTPRSSCFKPHPKARISSVTHHLDEYKGFHSTAIVFILMRMSSLVVNTSRYFLFCPVNRPGGFWFRASISGGIQNHRILINQHGYS